MMKLICLLVSVFLVACTSSQARLTTTSDICNPYEDKIRESIVKLNSSEGTTASGVIIAPNRILTVAHAVDNERRIFAEINGASTTAKVIVLDKKNDLALLEAPTKNLASVKLSYKDLNVNETVWAIGFPLAAKQRVSKGLYESLYKGRLYSSVHINNGTSGGGLLRCNEEGHAELAGIVHGYVANGDLVNLGDSLSVSSATIKGFIRSSYVDAGTWVNEDNRIIVLR